MSSGIRTIQKRIFRNKGYREHDHNGKHGGFNNVVVPDTDPPVTIKVTRFKWPLLPKYFNKDVGD